MTERCPVCEEELTSVTFVGPTQTLRVGRRCARIMEYLMRLMGADDVSRRPMLRVVE